MFALIRFLFYLGLFALIVLFAVGLAIKSLVDDALDSLQGAYPGAAEQTRQIDDPPQPVSERLSADGADSPVGLAHGHQWTHHHDVLIAGDRAHDHAHIQTRLDSEAPSDAAPIKVPVFLCGPPDTYTEADLDERVRMLQEHVTAFFERESSGRLTLQFTAVAVLSPESIDWEAVNLKKLHADAARTRRMRSNPCIGTALDRNVNATEEILVIAGMPSSGPDDVTGIGGYAYYGGPATAIDYGHYNNRAAPLDMFTSTVAHELGHSLLELCHPHQSSAISDVNDSRHGTCRPIGGTVVHGTSYTREEFQQYHNRFVFDQHDESVMSFAWPDAPGQPGVYEFEHHYVSCRQRYVLGWNLAGCRGAPVTDPGHRPVVALGSGLTSETRPFTDTAHSVHRDAIAALREAGITDGCNHHGPQYCPDTPTTRGQIATMIARALHLQTPQTPAPFTDTADSVHRDAIAALHAAGITDGCNHHGPQYCPDTPTTRGQIATMIARALHL